MRIFDWLFYRYFLLGKWDQRRSDEQAAWLAGRFFGFLTGINASAVLCIVTGVMGYMNAPGWLFIAVLMGGFGAMWYIYCFRRRYITVSDLYAEQPIRRSNWAMTGRFLLTMFLSIAEGITVLTLSALYMHGKLFPEWRF